MKTLPRTRLQKHQKPGSIWRSVISNLEEKKKNCRVGGDAIKVRRGLRNAKKPCKNLKDNGTKRGNKRNGNYCRPSHIVFKKLPECKNPNKRQKPLLSEEPNVAVFWTIRLTFLFPGKGKATGEKTG